VRFLQTVNTPYGKGVVQGILRQAMTSRNQSPDPIRIAQSAAELALLDRARSTERLILAN
jgi:hypothetical protein